ncbi:LysR family transcriptional regulator [Streptomyces sp. NPDC049813]|uniref:LysR family transcriptional regulator n=1 Tax=Streptomyces sp. NPDC049813 TaxID=3365597 RepID=UPI00378B2ACB
MTLDDLRVFVAVCRAGSLSAVARELSCTQSAVSQHVKRLEREVGVGLLERRPRGVVPTPAGRILRAAAADGLGALDQALRRLDDLARGESGSVRVTTGATSVRHFMAAAIVAFRRTHPRVGLEFQTVSSSRACFEALAAHDLDLAWITMGAPERGIELRPVVELPWVLAVRDDDALAARPHAGPEELRASAQLILPPAHSTSRAHLDERFAELGLVGGPAAGTGIADWDTAVHLAELGLGHALVPDLPGLRRPGGTPAPGLTLLPVPCLPPLRAGWAVRRWSALSPLARAFADTVAHTCPGRAAPPPPAAP